MQHNEHDKEKVVVAVKEIAKAVKSNTKPDISALFEATSDLPLKNLDYWESLIRWEYSNELEEFKQPKWRFFQKLESRPLTLIDICNSNGFVREKALKDLDSPIQNRLFFALIIRRLNDWVTQVQEAAYKAIPIVARKTNPEIIVDVLFPIFLYWNSWSRIRSKDKKLILHIASTKDIKIALKKRILKQTSGSVTSVLSQAGQTDILDQYLYEISQGAIQPSVRAKAYSCLLDEQMSWYAGREWQWTNKPYGKGYFKPIIKKRVLSITTPFIQTLQRAAIDRSPIVRRVAGDMLIKKLDKIRNEEALTLSQLLASDSSLSVAERGDFALRKIKE